ncbi:MULTISPECIES: ribbon-helix-helix protein, CopG family [Dietzia]|uniref:type II toxin-antitoxin system RelB family antitoxin n=1 Tax=Dietzia TaxID=37914 RepID=UPI0019D07748|nr:MULTISPECIES: ribbon-helix-helix protein, CopG family [Dietzia]
MTAKQLNTKLDDETLARLDHLARITGRSKSFYASEFIRSGLDEMEDWYLARHRLEEFRQSDDSAIPLDQVDWS